MSALGEGMICLNLILFLKQVDALNERLNKESLSEFVHEWARGLPENQRDAFLAELAKGLNPENLPKTPETRKEAESPSDECAATLAELERISTGDLRLTAQFNEEYDDWYDDGSEEFLYEDPHGVGETIDNAIDLAHKRMDMEDYANAYSLGNALIEICVSVAEDGEYDYDDFSLFDMRDVKRISRDLRPLVLETICAAYMTVSPEQRPETLYRLFEHSQEETVSFEDAMRSAGKELPGIAEFLDAWVAYLGGIKGELSRRLFEEAAFLRNDRDAFIRAASDYADIHPGLYERILLTERETGNADSLFTLGQEALAKLRPNLMVRSRIALLTAENALRMGNQDAAEQCWLEAFRSYPAPLGYLRLCTESRDFSRFRDEARNIYRTRAEQNPRDYPLWNAEKDELSESGMSKRDFYTLNFLDGDFQTVLNEGMNVTNALGWSSTFMKRGITLFLLYLYRGERLESGLRYLCGQMTAGMPFSWKEYAKGLTRPVTESNEDLFWERFRIWRESVPMPDEFQTRMIQRLTEWLELRVQGIMDANRRKYYDECAGFVAALGEVKESRGERDGKQTEALLWKAKYSRRTAFHQELRQFGMKDGKR